MPAELLTWIAADGTELPLDDSLGIRCEDGPDGRYMPPFDLDEQDAPDAGGWVAAARPALRTVSLPLAVEFADSAVASRALMRTLVRAFDPSRGPGILRATTIAGDVRELIAWYQSGLEADESVADPALTEYRCTVKLRADATWQDGAENVASWATGQAVGSFFPVPPLKLTGSEVYASAQVTIDGDVDTQPSWTITGPGSALELRNLTTGRSLAWGGTLAAGEQLTIDTRRRPHTRTPRQVLRNGANAFGDLTARDLWPLVAGTNQIEIKLVGATSASLVATRWRNRWLGV